MTLEVLQPTDYAADQELPRIAWTPASDDLHLNLVALRSGEAIGNHVNHSLDVVITCLAGSGFLAINDDDIPLTSGTLVVVPKGTNRGIVAGNNGLKYTTCHRKRGGIIPTVHRQTVCSSTPRSDTPRTGD